MLERTPNADDHRPFAQWRDETAAHFETIADRCQARAAISPDPAQRRRAQVLRKLARLLRAERS